VYLGIWLFGIGTSLGPPISLWPYLYSWPVLNFIRVPSRFMIVGVLGLAVIAGLAFDRLAAAWHAQRRQRVAAVLGSLMVLEFAAMPLWHTSFEIPAPAADRWLDSRPKPFAIAEVPVTLSERNQSYFMLHSMAHWQKTVNGYSGIRPGLHAELYGEMRRFPDETSLNGLLGLHVNYIVVHRSWYSPEERVALDAKLSNFAAWLTLEYSDADSRVWSLHEPQTALGTR